MPAIGPTVDVVPATSTGNVGFGLLSFAYGPGPYRYSSLRPSLAGRGVQFVEVDTAGADFEPHLRTSVDSHMRERVKRVPAVARPEMPETTQIRSFRNQPNGWHSDSCQPFGGLPVRGHLAVTRGSKSLLAKQLPRVYQAAQATGGTGRLWARMRLRPLKPRVPRGLFRSARAEAWQRLKTVFPRPRRWSHQAK